MTTPDLSLVAFDDLLAEVANRCESYIFYGRKHVRDTPEGAPIYAYRRRQKGPYDAVIFLGALLTHELAAELNQDWEDPDPWEEF